MAQARLIAKQLNALHPGLTVNLVQVETSGDRDQQTPLSQVRDADFFSAQLDNLLLAGEIDFCVHSRKDLNQMRPEGLQLAAIPQRELPHDIVFFSAAIRQRLQAGQVIRIGTSSLRREINARDFLPTALPSLGPGPQLEFVPLRGPVDQRLDRIADTAGAEHLDAVILALAGITRLWQDPDGRRRIESVIRHAPFMLLPLSEHPTAPGQGALAVECRANDPELLTLLAPLHDARSAAMLDAEQRAVAELAADSPEAVGASATMAPELDYVVHLRGRHGDGSGRRIAASRSGRPRMQPNGSVRPWQALDWHHCTRMQRHAPAGIEAAAVFVAHSDAVSHRDDVRHSRCWTSGPESWRALARLGVWVEGCTDNMGFASLQAFLDCGPLHLPVLADWVALTHSDAVVGWCDSGVGRVIATYTREIDVDAAAKLQSELNRATHFYWSSARQFEALRAWLPPHAQHACGNGKTLTALRQLGIPDVQPFASRGEWQQWLN